MKLQLLRVDQEPVKGYEQIFVDTNNMNLSAASDNECELILAPDLLDNFQGDAATQVLEALRSKLRLGGEIVVGGTDVRLFAKAVTSGVMTTHDASRLVTRNHSMSSWGDTRETLKGLGLSIKSVTLDGVHYEIKAIRQN